MAPSLDRAVRSYVRASSDRRIELTAGSKPALRLFFGRAAHAMRPAALRGIPGEVGFELRSTKGRHRAWTVTFTPDGAKAKPGEAVSPLFLVRCTTADLVRIAVGELSAGRALVTRRLDISGGLTAGVRLGASGGPGRESPGKRRNPR